MLNDPNPSDAKRLVLALCALSRFSLLRVLTALGMADTMHTIPAAVVVAGEGMNAMETLYEEAVRRGWWHDSHESDLYLPWTSEVVEACKARGLVPAPFRDQRDGVLRYEVPFAFDPFWSNRSPASRPAQEGR